MIFLKKVKVEKETEIMWMRSCWKEKEKIRNILWNLEVQGP